MIDRNSEVPVPRRFFSRKVQRFKLSLTQNPDPFFFLSTQR
jgi:hypothetical protein